MSLTLYFKTLGFLGRCSAGLSSLGSAIPLRKLAWPRPSLAFPFPLKLGVPSMFPFSPQLYLILALLAAIPATYGVMAVKRQIAVSHAYEAGKRVGEEIVAAATTAKAREIVTAQAEGEASAAPVPADKAAIIALCQRSASCRERKRP